MEGLGDIKSMNQKAETSSEWRAVFILGTGSPESSLAFSAEQSDTVWVVSCKPSSPGLWRICRYQSSQSVGGSSSLQGISPLVWCGLESRLAPCPAEDSQTWEWALMPKIHGDPWMLFLSGLRHPQGFESCSRVCPGTEISETLCRCRNWSTWIQPQKQGVFWVRDELQINMPSQAQGSCLSCVALARRELGASKSPRSPAPFLLCILNTKQISSVINNSWKPKQQAHLFHLFFSFATCLNFGCLTLLRSVIKAGSKNFIVLW